MAVFTFRTMEHLAAGVKLLASRLFESNPLILTPEEFIDSFIQPDHVHSLKQVHSLVGGIGQFSIMPQLQSSEGIKCTMFCTFGQSSPPIIMPNYTSSGLQPTAPDAVRTRIATWLDERIRLGNMFGDALDALHWLNDKCGNAPAMAVMFPALPTILKSVDPEGESTVSKRAKRIADAKSFGSLPKLPREVKQRMLECSDLLLAVSMLEPAQPTQLAKGQAQFKFEDARVRRDDFIYASTGHANIKNATFI